MPHPAASFNRSRPRLSGSVMYWSTPHSSRLSTACSECCHEMTYISGRRLPRGRRLSADRLPEKKCAAPSTTTASHAAARRRWLSAVPASRTTSAPAHESVSSTARRSMLSADMTATLFMRLKSSARAFRQSARFNSEKYAKQQMGEKNFAAVIADIINFTKFAS